MADRKDLDGGGMRRHRDHTELLVEFLDFQTIWDDYGIDSAVEVHY